MRGTQRQQKTKIKSEMQVPDAGNRESGFQEKKLKGRPRWKNRKTERRKADVDYGSKGTGGRGQQSLNQLRPGHLPKFARTRIPQKKMEKQPPRKKLYVLQGEKERIGKRGFPMAECCQDEREKTFNRRTKEKRVRKRRAKGRRH